VEEEIQDIPRWDEWSNSGADEERQRQCQICDVISSIPLFSRLIKKRRSHQELITNFKSSNEGMKKPSKSTTVPAGLADFVIIMKAGMMKAKINQSQQFQRMWIENDRLFWQGLSRSSDSLEEVQQVQLGEIKKIQKSKRNFSLTLLSDAVELNGEKATVHLEFERADEMKTFGRGLREMIKAYRNEEEQSDEHTPS